MIFFKIVNNLIIRKLREVFNMKVLSEVAGSVWKIEVAVGQAVAEGDTLLIVESMKMEIPVSAPKAGTVAEIRTAEGEPVADGQLLVILS
jgi:biotin carboxyl carrier protein